VHRGRCGGAVAFGEGAEVAVILLEAAKVKRGVDAAMDIAEDMICAAASILASETVHTIRARSSLGRSPAPNRSTRLRGSN